MNSIPVEYFISDAHCDFDAFMYFVKKHVIDNEDVENICFYCNLDKDRFAFVQHNHFIPKSVLYKKPELVDWSILYSEYEKYFDDDTVRELKDYIDFDALSCFGIKVSEQCISQFKDRFNFKILSNTRILSSDFMHRHNELLNWRDLTLLRIRKDKLDDAFIQEFKDCIDWHVISEHGVLTTEQINKYKSYIDWSNFTVWHHFIDDELERFNQFIDWKMLEQTGNWFMRGLERKKALEKHNEFLHMQGML